MARPRKKRPTRRRRGHETHALVRIPDAGGGAALDRAWECECGASVVNWIETVEIESTVACSSGAVTVSTISQILPRADPVRTDRVDVLSYRCRADDHGRMPHSHHVTLVETIHGTLTTEHMSRAEAVGWLHAQGFHYEDRDLDDENGDDGPGSPP